MRTTTLLIGCLCTLLAGCTGADSSHDGASDSTLGTLTFALTGTLPGIQAFKLAIYEGPLVNTKQSARFDLACAPYRVSAVENRNAFTLRDMPAGKNYSVLVQFYADQACTDLKIHAYRGGVEVIAGSSEARAATPYYMQPVRFGGFVGMAQANSALQAEAEQRSCSSDQDCVAVHPAATCSAGQNRCTISSLFPLNGGARRAFPTLISLADGSIAVAGGFSVVDAKTGVWSATTSKVERFDPKLGRFFAPAAFIDNFDVAGRVGMAAGAALGGATFGMVGGTQRLQLKVAGTKLTTTLQDATCAGGGAVTCPASKSIWRVDLLASLSSGLEIDQPIAMPIVARVASANGPRLLVAGGVSQPIPKSGSNRLSDTRLCTLSGTAATCDTNGGKLNVARANAAFGCIAPAANGCKTLLIIGGRIGKKAALVEQYHADTDSFETLETDGAPPMLFGGQLVKAGSSFYLLGASKSAFFLEGRVSTTAQGVAPLKVIIDDAGATRRVRFEAVKLGSFAGKDGGKRLFAAAIGLTSGHALLAGGITPDGTVANTALVFDKDGVIDRIPLETGRFGAAITEIDGTSPFAGCAFMAGGARLSPTPAALSHIEIYCPPRAEK